LLFKSNTEELITAFVGINQHVQNKRVQ